MLRTLPFLLLAGLAGCTYNPHRDFSADYGESVNANIAAQVVNPVPLQPLRPAGVDAVRVNSAFERYETNRVYRPAPVQSLQSPSGGSAGGGGGGAPPTAGGGAGGGAGGSGGGGTSSPY